MAPELHTAIIASASALLGSACGSLITHYIYRCLKSDEKRLSALTKEINSRKDLYAEFLAEASRLGIMSLSEKNGDHSKFLALNAITSRIELTGGKRVIKQVNMMVEYLLHLHSPDRDPVNDFLDIKKGFIDAVKKELRQL